MDLEKLILELFAVEGIKFGNYTLKSGIEAPVYVDLRVVISYPKLMVEVSNFLWEAAKKAKGSFKTICGVPYTALPLATCISVKENIPMLIRRKEAKGYGTKKLIEGIFNEGDGCLIIEDVCTSGSSVLDTVQALNSVGIAVTDAVVLLDREQGAVDMLKYENITLHSICKLSHVIEVLEKHGKIDSDMVSKVKTFITENRFKPPSSIDQLPKKVLTYGERSELCTHPVTKELFKIMHEKETNLVVSADLKTTKEVLQVLKKIGPHICMAKTHIDIIEDYNPEFVTQLCEIAKKHNFLLFEDRKFADIGNTVKLQYSSGLYRISDWAHVINAHSVPGEGVVKGLKEVGLVKDRACLLIAEMSSLGNLATGDYTVATIKMAEENKDFVVGFISQKKLCDDPTLVHMTPGVKLECGKDSLGQQYLTPDEVIGRRGSDIIIVGRGIVQAHDIVKAAKAYQQAGYLAYQQLLP
ncbi:hypothetical protein SNE40_003130 [Patella caerulea]|uniref:Uridine 5'-monophosphate synthase n=1 Tax=Patella caerulea TaxID=87958 RepID=A0AAN8K938_PATCE